MSNELRRLECKKVAQQRLEDVITACNKGDMEELRALMVSGLMSDDTFNSIIKPDGELINDDGIFRCDGYYFQCCEEFCYTQTEPKHTDRYVIWGFAQDESMDESILDVVYWTWGSPFIGDKCLDSVLDQCRTWVKKSKEQGLKPYKENIWTK